MSSVKVRMLATCEQEDCDAREEYWGKPASELGALMFGGPSLPDGWEMITRFTVKNGKRDWDEPSNYSIACANCVAKLKDTDEWRKGLEAKP